MSSPPDGPDTLLWEVEAAPGCLPDVMSWVTSAVVERLREEPSCRDLAVYEVSDDRAALVAHFAGPPVPVPEPPPALVAGPPQQRSVRRLL